MKYYTKDEIYYSQDFYTQIWQKKDLSLGARMVFFMLILHQALQGLTENDLREICKKTGISKWQLKKYIRELEQKNYIKKEKMVKFNFIKREEI